MKEQNYIVRFAVLYDDDDDDDDDDCDDDDDDDDDEGVIIMVLTMRLLMRPSMYCTHWKDVNT